MDTNILIDLLINENNSKEYDKIRGSAQAIRNTREVIEKCINEDVLFVINTTSISNATYFLQERQKIGTQKVMDKISQIEENKDLFLVVLETEDLRYNARKYAQENNADYEDALQYFCALKSGCELIFTNDKNFPKLDISLKRTNGTEDYLVDTV